VEQFLLSKENLSLAPKSKKYIKNTEPKGEGILNLKQEKEERLPQIKIKSVKFEANKDETTSMDKPKQRIIKIIPNSIE
jgi:hypothetical protein